jgi:hypothetical protein
MHFQVHTVTTRPRQCKPIAARSVGPAAAYMPPVGWTVMHFETPGRQYQLAVPESECRATGGRGVAVGFGVGVGAAVGAIEALGVVVGGPRRTQASGGMGRNTLGT